MNTKRLCVCLCVEVGGWVGGGRGGCTAANDNINMKRSLVEGGEGSEEGV